MTESQRDYLADLAGKKGVQLSETDGLSVSQASVKIEELKALPDVNFPEISDGQIAEIDKRVRGVLSELRNWGFVRRTAA